MTLIGGGLMSGKTENIYVNRELSWLMFNERVLQEACCEDTPLFERLRFVSIFSSNLDEFFMVRVGSLIDQMLLKDKTKDGKTKMTPKEQLSAIYLRVHELIPAQNEAFSQVMKKLKKQGVGRVLPDKCSEEDFEFLKLYFEREILPVCSCQIIDDESNHPFPFLENKSLFVGVHIAHKGGIRFGIVTVSEKFPKAVFLPGRGVRFALVEDIICHFADRLLKKHKIISKMVFRITRNADIDVNDIVGYDFELDYRSAMSELLKKRRKLAPVRLEVSYSGDRDAVTFLADKLGLAQKQVFLSAAPLAFGFMGEVEKRIKNDALFYSPLTPQKSPQINEKAPMIPQIQKKDLFLHYPYESMESFIRLLNEAAADPKVESIKITLYRMASHSKIVRALIKAAEAGKQVYASVELRARFDEENNIDWSKTLEEAGVNVSYGLSDYKVHSKLLLITRRGVHSAEYITQIGTGNYNEKTAMLYTDMCIITANKVIGEDAKRFFDSLLSGGLVKESNALLVAPLCLKNKITELIDREIAHAKFGGRGLITLKFNSLTDKELIDKLIEASKAGVKINMIVRGICCLKSGVPEQTENIRVMSIVGRFLEHSRIYCFGEGEREKIYIASADFMTRNTDRRVEIGAPVYDDGIKQRIKDILKIMLSDNVKARAQKPDGTYEYIKNENPPLESQLYFYRQAYERADKYMPGKKRGFIRRIISKLKGES